MVQVGHPAVSVWRVRRSLIGQDSPLGDGAIDNFIIDRSVHLVTGSIVLLTMVAATALVMAHGLKDEPIRLPAKIAIGAAQLALIAQALIGIKLLDQGQGVVQLYIHYLGGLLPLGAFLVGGWMARGDTGLSSRILAGLLLLGSFSAVMAFVIGRAYVNG